MGFDGACYKKNSTIYNSNVISVPLNATETRQLFGDWMPSVFPLKHFGHLRSGLDYPTNQRKTKSTVCHRYFSGKEVGLDMSADYQKADVYLK